MEGDADVTAWTTAIHTACAASLARHLNRDSAIRLLQSKMRQLEISIDLVRPSAPLCEIIAKRREMYIMFRLLAAVGDITKYYNSEPQTNSGVGRGQ